MFGFAVGATQSEVALLPRLNVKANESPSGAQSPKIVVVPIP